MRHRRRPEALFKGRVRALPEALWNRAWVKQWTGFGGGMWEVGYRVDRQGMAGIGAGRMPQSYPAHGRCCAEGRVSKVSSFQQTPERRTGHLKRRQEDPDRKAVRE
ncbi:hypothetical protein P153DRAFT_191820 [Dothidotthia symphoricarpi CBS 119687]|uniref:Uncharacterized protein n=1 Tax=Dothidotthia symphoricarpi CBS 119687 TaxID=1392245 RepID=A0A6A6ALF9_9PLEO|nr:uncharacterized protein P153DRAFT_191820 [Dothidotthia symphoricarpi CBS 119687]KAF2131291.1 hypothetical protein P153DRAFT_191820 [Dothidotthia symphoricarpi CBS 119687]